eukprot:SAG11_NODE_21833_length_417_cov_6.144654_1_plen_57_part_01
MNASTCCPSQISCGCFHLTTGNWSEQAAWEQAVEEQIRRKGLMEGEVEELAMCVGAA